MDPADAHSRRRVLLGTGATAAAALAGCVSSGGGTGTDGRGGADGEAGTETTAADEPMAAGDWPTGLHDAQRNPVVDDRTGPVARPERLWTYDLPTVEEDFLEGSARPVVHDGTVYAQALEGTCVALDAVTGAVQWERSVPREGPIDASVVAPVATDDALYVASEGVRALEPEDGSERWHVPTRLTTDWIGTTDESVLANDFDRVYAIDPETGDVRWQTDVRLDPSSVAVDESGERVFVYDTLQSTLHALDASTGEREWGFEPTVGWADMLTVDDGTVYAANSMGTSVMAVDAVDGTQTWRTTPGWAEPLAVADDAIYAVFTSGDRQVGVLDPADGSLRSDWSLDANVEVLGAPVVASQTLFAWTLDDDRPGLLAADRSTGALHWQLDLDGPTDGFAVTGNLLVLYEDGAVVALGPE